MIGSFKNKKILYVTSEWSALTDVLSGESEKPRGMPAFIKPLQAFKKEGADILLIILSDSEIRSVKSVILNGIYIKKIIWPSSKSAKGVLKLILCFKQVYKIAKEYAPDFIYSMGSAGALGLLVAKLIKVPVGVRIFGTNIYYPRLKQQGTLRFIMSSPLLSLLFRCKSDFILATNDGSESDQIYRLIGNKKSKFKFWRNGVDLPVEVKKKQGYQDSIFYPGRICEKKQQVKAVQLLAKLHAAGEKKIKLLLAGHVTEPAYLEEVFVVAKKLGVDKKVKYLGTIETSDVYQIMASSLAVLSLQKVSNLSNVLLESLACGAILISYDEVALSQILQKDTSAILITSIDEIVPKLCEIKKDPQKEVAMRNQAKIVAQTQLVSWSKRIEEERKLIIDVILQKTGAL